MHSFVVLITVGTTHGDTQYSVNKQTNKIFNIPPSGDRNYQFILAAHTRCFLEENKFSFPVHSCFSQSVNCGAAKIENCFQVTVLDSEALES